MAREQLITRTVLSTRVTVLGVDEGTGESGNRTYILPGDYKDKDKEKVLKKVIAVNQEKTYHPAVIVEMTTDEKVMGLEISKFLELAHEVVRPESQQKKA